MAHHTVRPHTQSPNIISWKQNFIENLIEIKKIGNRIYWN